MSNVAVVTKVDETDPFRSGNSIRNNFSSIVLRQLIRIVQNVVIYSQYVHMLPPIENVHSFNRTGRRVDRGKRTGSVKTFPFLPHALNKLHILHIINVAFINVVRSCLRYETTSQVIDFKLQALSYPLLRTNSIR